MIKYDENVVLALQKQLFILEALLVQYEWQTFIIAKRLKHFLAQILLYRAPHTIAFIVL
jgi:hypothetical protein